MVHTLYSIESNIVPTSSNDLYIDIFTNTEIQPFKEECDI